MYLEKNIHVMDSFEFETGRILENLNVEYWVSGTPKYDNGNIVNAVVYFPNFTSSPF